MREKNCLVEKGERILQKWCFLIRKVSLRITTITDDSITLLFYALLKKDNPPSASFCTIMYIDLSRSPFVLGNNVVHKNTPYTFKRKLKQTL